MDWEALLEAEDLGVFVPRGSKRDASTIAEKQGVSLDPSFSSWTAFCAWEFRERFGREWKTVSRPTKAQVMGTIERRRPDPVLQRGQLRSWRAALVHLLDKFGMGFRVPDTFFRRVSVDAAGLNVQTKEPVTIKSTIYASGDFRLVETDELVQGFKEAGIPEYGGPSTIGPRVLVERLERPPKKGEKRDASIITISVAGDVSLTARDMALVGALLGLATFRGRNYEKALERETAAMERMIRLHGRRGSGAGPWVRGPADERPGTGVRKRYPTVRNAKK